MDTSRMQPETSSLSNAYRMQDGGAGARALPQRVVSFSSGSRIGSLLSRDKFGEASFLELEDTNPRYPPAVVRDCRIAYPCLHIDCQTLCYNEQSLRNHMEIYHTVAHNVTSCTYQRPISQAPGGHIYDYSTVGYPNSYESATAPLATHANYGHGMTYPPVTGYDFQSAAPYQHTDSDKSYGLRPVTSFQPATVASSTAPTIANGRLSCSHIGCGETFRRQCELNRHAKKHQVGPKDLDCPVRDCDRKGANGFMRKDKLMDHLKAKHRW